MTRDGGVGIVRRGEHVSVKSACGETWVYDNLSHQCRYHIVETGECLCPCGARQKKAAKEVDH